MRMRFFFRGVLCLFLCTSFSLLSQEEPKLYLTSEVDVSSKFIQQVKKEKSSIRMATYRLSDFGVIRALLEAHKKGVSVEVLVDSISITKNTLLTGLSKEGVSVFVWKNPKASQGKKHVSKRMHHCFCVFSSDLSWVGSYIFSSKRFSGALASAMLLQDESISKKYLDEFESMKKQATSLSVYLEKKGV